MTRAVLVAFLLPIFVFAASLGAMAWWLEGRVAGPYRTPVALLVALSVTTAWMLIVRAVSQRHTKK